MQLKEDVAHELKLLHDLKRLIASLADVMMKDLRESDVDVFRNINKSIVQYYVHHNSIFQEQTEILNEALKAMPQNPSSSSSSSLSSSLSS